MYADPRIDQLVRLLGDDADVRAILDSDGGPKSTPRLIRQLTALAFERGIDLNSASEFARPDSQLVAGPIPIGETEYGQPVGLHTRDLQHMNIDGKTRGGKSNFILVLLFSLYLVYRELMRWWILDRKAEYRFLALENLAPVVIRADADLRWNPMKPPPGVPVRKHIHRNVGLLAQAFGLGEAGRALLIKVHKNLYDFYKPWERSRRWPTLHDLEHALKTEADRNPKDHDLQGYVARILNKLSPMLFVMGEIFACEEDFIEQLVGTRVVFETDMLEGPMLTYVTTGLLQWYMSYRLDNNLRGPLDTLLVIDECKKFYDRQKEKNATEVSYLAEATSQIAEFGTGIIASDQQPSAVARVIQANAASTACFSLVEGTEIWAVSESLRLTKAQADALPGLPTGTAVFRKAEGWVEPFLLRVPLARIRKDATREEIERVNEPRLNALHWTPAPREVHARVYTEPDPQATAPRTNAGRRRMQEDVGLPPECRAFLQSVLENPILSLSQHYRSAGLSGSQVTKVKHEVFTRRHLAGSVRIGRWVFPYLTAAGYAAMNARPRGKGEDLHVGLQAITAAALRRKGMQDIRIEGALGGKQADVTARAGDQLLAFEIELRNSEQAVLNITKDLEVGFSEVIVLSPSASVLAAIEQAATAVLDQSLRQRVRFLEMKNLLERS